MSDKWRGLAGAAAVVLVLVLALVVGIGQKADTVVLAGSTGYGYLFRDEWTVTVAGGGAAGAQTGSEAQPGGGMEGLIYAIHLDYTPSVSSTTDVTITVGSNPTQTIMYKADSATDAWFYPGVQLTGGTGAAISGAYERAATQGSVLASVGESSTGTLTVTLLWGK